MDDRLQELFYRVQQTAVDLGNTAADMAATAVRGAENLVQMGRQRTALIDLKAEVNLQLREIGELVYGTHTGTPTESEVLLEKLQEIDGLRARITELNAKVSKESAVSACPFCGAASRPGDAFCRECGGKL